MENALKNRIMRRIYLISYCRKASTVFALKIYFSILLIIGLLYNVSVVSVFKNAIAIGDQDMGGVLYFSKYALMHTDLMVQIIFALTLGFAGYLMTISLKDNFYSRS